jgi:hypothetical protein
MVTPRSDSRGIPGMDLSGRNYILAGAILSSLVFYIIVNFSRMVKLVLQRRFEHSMLIVLPGCKQQWYSQLY